MKIVIVFLGLMLVACNVEGANTRTVTFEPTDTPTNYTKAPTHSASHSKSVISRSATKTTITFPPTPTHTITSKTFEPTKTPSYPPTKTRSISPEPVPAVTPGPTFNPNPTPGPSVPGTVVTPTDVPVGNPPTVAPGSTLGPNPATLAPAVTAAPVTLAPGATTAAPVLTGEPGSPNAGQPVTAKPAVLIPSSVVAEFDFTTDGNCTYVLEMTALERAQYDAVLVDTINTTMADPVTFTDFKVKSYRCGSTIAKIEVTIAVNENAVDAQTAVDAAYAAFNTEVAAIPTTVSLTKLNQLYLASSPTGTAPLTAAGVKTTVTKYETVVGLPQYTVAPSVAPVSTTPLSAASVASNMALLLVALTTILVAAF